MKWILYCVLTVAVAMLSACSGGSAFKISADIKSLGNQNVHVVFLGDSGVVDRFIPVNDGKFSVEGHSQDYTIVSILDSQNRPLMRLAAKGGDNIELSGDFNNPHHYQCKGSDASQEWFKFESEHAMLYDVADSQPLDAAIEKYVKANPSSVVSTLLLVADYSDCDKAMQLLTGIEKDARPASLVASLQQYKDAMGKPATQLHTMLLCGTNGDFESLTPATAKSTLIYWWTDNNNSRRENIKDIKKIAEKHGDKLQVADVTLMPDTSAWRAIIKTDSTRWNHYWAPGGILDPSVENLKLRQLPLCIVADSTGKQIYRGSDIKAAATTLDKHLTK